MRVAADSEAVGVVVLRRLIGLRWAVFGLLVATLPLDEFLFQYHVRYEIAAPILVIATAANVWLTRRAPAGHRDESALLPLVVAFNLVAIGGVLAAAGGAGNPFSALFFVYVALAAALLPARTTFALAALAACLFAGLFALPQGACCPNHPEHGAFSTHLYGMLLAFVSSSGIVAYFLTRMRRALEEGAAENARLKRQAEEASRFAALGTLAAGTAHELATPLGTIAVLAGEIRDDGSADDARRHAGAISAQVERCKGILTKMRASTRPMTVRAGIELGPAVEKAVRVWGAAHPEVPVDVRAEGDAGSRLVRLEGEDLEAALSALLDNALHATKGMAEPSPIVVRVEDQGGTPVVCVEDRGHGVPSHLEGRLGEPFMTTKEPGEGMGLGLYFVRSMIEQIGGRVEVSARRPSGTRVALRLAPADG